MFAMAYRARPTLRCLFEELVTGVEDQAQRSALMSGSVDDLEAESLVDIAHPLLAKANEVAQKSGTELHATRIKSVDRGTFYKAKVGRWRGAVWFDESRRPWLCAAGLRREGERDDFYDRFARECEADVTKLLPNSDDLLRLRAERVRYADDFRLMLLRGSVISALMKALDEDRAVTVPLPVTIDPVTLRPLVGAKLTLGLLADEGGEGAMTLSVEVTDYQKARYDDVLVEVKTALPGLSAEEWEVVPPFGEHTAPCWWVVVTTGWIARYRQAVSDQGLVGFAESPPDLSDGSDGFTHIVAAESLADAMVSQAVINALCGRRFVPLRNPDNHPVCPTCAGLLGQLEQLVEDAEQEG